MSNGTHAAAGTAVAKLGATATRTIGGALEAVRRVRLPQRHSDGPPDSAERPPGRAIPSGLRKLPRRPVVLLALALAVAVALSVTLTGTVLASNTFTVTNTNDSGDGSLRKAITDANATSNGLLAPDAIRFNIPTPTTADPTYDSATGVFTISPTSSLPTITDPVSIDGYTQQGAIKNTLAQGNDAKLVIELNGTDAGQSSSGVTLGASNSTVKGLVINRFGQQGIDINSSASGNRVEGNFIGTNATATSVATSNSYLSGIGVSVGGSNNTIGGTTPEARNVVSGNDHGISIYGSGARGNRIEGNYIGTDATGTSVPANSAGQGNGIGVQISGAPNNFIGGATSGARNVISGNADAVRVVGSGSTANSIEGNYIGTDASGISPLGNVTGTKGNSVGISIEDAPNNTVGGTTTGARNVISDNSYGVGVQGSGATGNSIKGNYIGTDKNGTSPMGNAIGVAIASPNNTVGGTASGSRNVISGNDHNGVEIFNSGNNTVEGNYIGTDESGQNDLGNSRYGVYVWAPDNTVGGTASGSRNVISGNDESGIFVTGSEATGNSVQGNYIGTDNTGKADLGNKYNGVDLNSGSNNTVGGTASGARNVISGNDMAGVSLASSDSEIEGNYIGTDATGKVDLGNSQHGVLVWSSATKSTIGGTASGAGNVISGNHSQGILLASSDIKVQGNYVGTDESGQEDLGNSDHGVVVFGSKNTIGGTASGARNIISGNGGIPNPQNPHDGAHGVLIFGSGASGNEVEGNYVGTDTTGQEDVGNSGIGVAVLDGNNNTIGGTAPGAPNIMAFNGRDGAVVVSPTTSSGTNTGNAILSNSIFSNGHLGIDLGAFRNYDNGFTANDPGDGDPGPNALQNFPELSSAIPSGGTTTVEGTLDSTPSSTFTVQFFSSPEKDPSGYGEGKTYLGEKSVTTDASGNGSFTFDTTSPSVGEFVTATATSSANDTSEFSNAVTVSTAPSISSVTNGGAIDEGSSASITVAATDAENDTLSYEFDCDGDNAFEVGPQASNTTSCAYDDDDTNRVNARVTDGNGGEDTDYTDVTVNNVSPILIAPATQQTDMGTSTNFQLGSFFDPGDDGPWQVNVDWGDNSTDDTIVVGTSPGSLGHLAHTYTDDRTYTVTVTVTENGTTAPPSGSTTFQVTAINPPPEITAPAVQRADEGEDKPFDLGSFTDSGDGTPYRVSVDWGDNSTDSTFEATSTGAIGQQSHTYADDGNYIVTVTVSEAGMGTPSDSATFHVAVSNVAPSVTAPANQSTDERTERDFDMGSFVDPGTDGPWQVSVDWGDNSTATTFQAASPGSLGQQSHTYADKGNYTVTVTVAEAGTGAPPSDSATFQVAVANVAPVADADSYGVDEDGTLEVGNTVGVLDGDTDAGGDALEVADADPTSTEIDPVGGPANGTLALKADGSFTYTPQANFNGTDTFTYKATDGTDESEVATVTIEVKPINDTPNAQDYAVETPEDTPVKVAVLANDPDPDQGDSLTVTKVSDPDHGTATIDPDKKIVTYEPTKDYNGDDSFTYTVSDGNGGTDTATVNVKILSETDTPISNEDFFVVKEDKKLTVAAPGVLLNDADADGDNLLASVVTGPAKGNLALNRDGSFTYVPKKDFSGVDTFTYRASDVASNGGAGGDAKAAAESEATKVTITVKGAKEQYKHKKHKKGKKGKGGGGRGGGGVSQG